MKKIYGECVCGSAHAPVTISMLEAERCHVALERAERLDGEMALWIGAIGPIEFTPQRETARSFTARFKQPLERAIIEHFNV